MKPSHRASGLLVTASLLAAVSLAHATTISVTIDSSILNGVPAVLAFDFLNGGLPDNSVTLSALTSNGTQGSTSTSGNVTGSGPWTFSDAGASFFNELQVSFNPMGTSLSFSFTATDNPPGPTSAPDGFSMYVLDATANATSINTDDPTGADALFLFSTGQGLQGLSVYTPVQEGFSIEAVPAQAPEPWMLALLFAAAVALLAKGQFRRGSALH